jgi:hypothetical protein
MSSDPNDELAQARARRERGERLFRPNDGEAAEAADPSEDQAAAIARAREAWLLRRSGRGAPPEDESPERE